MIVFLELNSSDFSYIFNKITMLIWSQIMEDKYAKKHMFHFNYFYKIFDMPTTQLHFLEKLTMV